MGPMMDMAARIRAAGEVPADLAHRRVTRAELAALLTALDLPMTAKALATEATRGSGPPFGMWGRLTLYEIGEAVAWSRRRLRGPRARRSGGADAAVPLAGAA